MQALSKADLEPLFARLRALFAAQREALIDLDSKAGDSDLGITMNKAFDAMHASVAANDAEPLGKTLQRAGMAAAKAAPSTMGTLVATGFMRGGKVLEGADEMDTAGMAAFWSAFLAGVEERGKARRGDKTLIDVLAPVAESLAASRAAGAALPTALVDACTAAAAGLEATRAMVAQHGKAAAFREKTVGLQDAGGTVVHLLVAAFAAHVNQETS